MKNMRKLITPRFNLILKSIKDCGITYTLQNICVHVGLAKRYPANASKFAIWEKNDKITKAIEQILNHRDFISPEKEIKILSEEIILNLRNGIRIYLRPKKYLKTDLHTIYETIFRQDYGIVNPGETVIDVGAYIGDFAILTAHLGARVYAFEPSPESFKQLLRNIELMNFNSIKAFNVAICSSKKAKKRVTLSYDDLNPGATRISDLTTSLSGVECMSLKEVFNKNKINQCDLLKLDCEGSEYEILEDLDSEIYSKIKKVVLEFHHGCPKKLEKLRRKLEYENFFVKTLISPYSRVEGLMRCWKL